MTEYEKSKLDQLCDLVSDSSNAMAGQSEARKLGVEFENDPNLSDLTVICAGVLASSFGMQVGTNGGASGDVQTGWLYSDFVSGMTAGLVGGGIGGPAIGAVAGMMGAAYGSSYTLCKEFYGW